MSRVSVRILTTVALAVAAVSSARTSESPVAASLAALKAGNARFVADAPKPPSVDVARRKALATGQHPFAILLSCADSRVPPEYVFNVGLGDLFVVRVAGEVVDRSVLASTEYAAEHLEVPLLVVLGHESCGAVKAAAESTGKSLGPNLDYLVKAIQPAVVRSASERDHVKGAILANVEQVTNDIVAKSAILRERVEEGKLGVVGAYYELESGKVTFSQPVTAEAVAALHHGSR
jgi:carbonic anhydrase